MARFLTVLVLALALALGAITLHNHVTNTTAIPMDHAMDYRTASVFILPFGKWSGKQLDEIGTSDDGLRYLDWLRGAMDGNKFVRPQWLTLDGERQVQAAVGAYLDDPTIAKELAELIGSK